MGCRVWTAEISTNGKQAAGATEKYDNRSAKQNHIGLYRKAACLPVVVGQIEISSPVLPSHPERDCLFAGKRRGSRRIPACAPSASNCWMGFCSCTPSVRSEGRGPSTS